MAAPVAAAGVAQGGVMAGGELAKQLFAQKFAREQARRQAEVTRQQRLIDALNSGTSFQSRALDAAFQGIARATL